jgi:hypothetical protein
MYHNLRSLYWWTRKKWEIDKYVLECDLPVYQSKSLEGSWYPATTPYTILEMGGYKHGFHCRFTQYFLAP